MSNEGTVTADITLTTRVVSNVDRLSQSVIVYSVTAEDNGRMVGGLFRLHGGSGHGIPTINGQWIPSLAQVVIMANITPAPRARQPSCYITAI